MATRFWSAISTRRRVMWKDGQPTLNHMPAATPHVISMQTRRRSAVSGIWTARCILSSARCWISESTARDGSSRMRQPFWRSSASRMRRPLPLYISIFSRHRRTIWNTVSDRSRFRSSSRKCRNRKVTHSHWSVSMKNCSVSGLCRFRS